MKKKNDVVWVASSVFNNSWAIECRNDDLGVVAYLDTVTKEFWFTDSSGDAFPDLRYIYPAGDVVERDGKWVWEGNLRIDGVSFF